MKITAPKTPLPEKYAPVGGQVYKVTNADSWASLARTAGVDVWWLIQYNFETRDPAEINWYLKHRVGCTRTTVDGRNYRFSDADKPGVIHLPSPSTVRAMVDLSYGKFGIVIKGDEDYQLQVKVTLDWIRRSDTGLVLLDAIGSTGKRVQIVPWKGAECNATAGATDWEDATAKGEPIFQGGFSMKTESSVLRGLLGLPLETAEGTGAGSDVVVSFSPAMWGYGSTGPCAGFAGMPGANPSQVLFHELAHAYREARGLMMRRPTVGSSAGYTDMEEFFAVVLSNVLIADPTYSCANRTLRADHSGFVPLAPALCTSHAFAAHVPNRNKLRELVASDPGLTSKLRAVNSSFNPFAETL